MTLSPLSHAPFVLVAVEVKLVDVPEMGYTAKGQPPHCIASSCDLSLWLVFLGLFL